MRSFCLTVFLCSVALAEPESTLLSRPNPLAAPAGQRMWKASLLSLAGATALDAASSWGKCEGNSLIAGGGGRFDSRSLSLKSAAIGGLMAFEHFSGKKHPQLYRLFSATNFAVSGGLSAYAVRNFGIAAPSPGYSCR